MLSSRKSILYLAAFLGLLLLTPLKANASVIEDQAIGLINQERQKQNLQPLSYSENLYNASFAHNKTMVECSKKYGNSPCFTHTVTLLGEQTLLNRIKATGYKAQAVAENIAWGHTTAGGIIGAWMASSGHKANIMGNYKDVGCSYVSPYWTCDFGRPSVAAGSSATPTPTKVPSATPTKLPTPTVELVTPTNIAPTVPSSTGKPWWCVYAPTFNLCQ